MSIFSDYKCGALSDEQFENECRRMNRQDNIEREELEDMMRAAVEKEQENDDDADCD